MMSSEALKELLRDVEDAKLEMEMTRASLSETMIHLKTQLVALSSINARLRAEELDAWEQERDEICIRWSYIDVLEQAKNDEVDLTDDEARDILQIIENNHDCNYGITWETISGAIARYK